MRAPGLSLGAVRALATRHVQAQGAALSSRQTGLRARDSPLCLGAYAPDRAVQPYTVDRSGSARL